MLDQLFQSKCCQPLWKEDIALDRFLRSSRKTGRKVNREKSRAHIKIRRHYTYRLAGNNIGQSEDWWNDVLKDEGRCFTAYDRTNDI